MAGGLKGCGPVPARGRLFHHYIDTQLVGAVEGDIVKLSVNADAVPKQEAAGQKV
jgi:hypothetical protein